MINETFTELELFSFGNSIKKLGASIQRDVAEACKNRDSRFDPKLFPVLYLLQKFEKSTVQKLAENLQITHPAVIQILNKLKELNFIGTMSGLQDKRQTYARLTENGKELLNNWLELYSDIENVNKEIIEESGYDVLNMINSIYNLLNQKNYKQRLDEKVKKRIMSQVEIITYNKKYKKYFKHLNYEWLEQYFFVEPEDDKLLNDPEKFIIKKGGQIFFARINNKIIGTCAAIKIDRYTFELSKMAVTKQAQGKQAGKKLALSVIGFAFSKKAKFVTLLTNKKLFPAINLYKQLGFEIEYEEVKSNYERKIFRMTLLLQ
ncbi:MAG: bifunctional helix-turn-helix transcriptional regulator/GNAT family N-acetyltransferase [Bacteroidetes bacterium]|nr:bifunctional helix-turn-helix transcriptional regulator/GNAT family N-acetyltransferase [Bacteroidota bacterium]